MNRLIYKLQKRFMRTCENYINYTTMQRMMRDNPNIILIDVRTKDEYKYNHLKGAINISLQDISRKNRECY